MKSVLLNRVAMVLSIVGMYIAGVLSYSSAMKVEVPCKIDSTSNCAAVTNSAAGSLFGIPVAYLGFLAYAVILVVAIMRSKESGPKWNTLTKVGFWMSGAGLAFSLYLQTVSITQIQQLCTWCLSSAVTMLGLFIVHGMISQLGLPEAAEHDPLAVAKGLAKPDMTLLAAMAILGFAAFGFTAMGMKKELTGPIANFNSGVVSVAELTSEPAKILGNADAKVVVVEIADILCPACRATFPDMKKLYEKHGGKLKYTYVAFPLFNLPGHETAIEAAMVAEFAAEKNKYWDYMEAAFDHKNDERVKSVSGLIGIADQIGLDTKELKERMNVEVDSSLSEKVNRDFNIAVERLGLQNTPTFLLSVNGSEFEAYNFQGLQEALKQPDVAKFLK